MKSGISPTCEAYHGRRQEKREQKCEHTRHAVQSQELDGDSGHRRLGHRSQTDMMLRKRVGEAARLAAFSERDVSGNKPSTSRTRTRDVPEGGTKAGHSAL